MRQRLKHPFVTVEQGQKELKPNMQEIHTVQTEAGLGFKLDLGHESGDFMARTPPAHLCHIMAVTLFWSILHSTSNHTRSVSDCQTLLT